MTRTIILRYYRHCDIVNLDRCGPGESKAAPPLAPVVTTSTSNSYRARRLRSGSSFRRPAATMQPRDCSQTPPATKNRRLQPARICSAAATLHEAAAECGSAWRAKCVPHSTRLRNSRSLSFLPLLPQLHDFCTINKTLVRQTKEFKMRSVCARARNDRARAMDSSWSLLVGWRRRRMTAGCSPKALPALRWSLLQWLGTLWSV